MLDTREKVPGNGSFKDEPNTPYLCVACGKESDTHICEQCREWNGGKIEAKVYDGRKELERAQIEKFILGGNAYFTLHNTKKGTHLTYKVSVCKDNPELFFVSVLTGPDNWTNYSFLGTIRERIYWHGKKSKISKDAPSAKTFEWFYNNLNRLPKALLVLHEGKCGRCGRDRKSVV